MELFHRGTAALNRGDVEYAVRRSTEDVVFIAARSAIEGFVGHEGVRKFFADNATNFEVFQAPTTMCGTSATIGSSRVRSVPLLLGFQRWSAG